MNVEDLKIETLVRGNKGGQHCGLPPVDIRVTHVPSGLIAQCGSERSQMRNRNTAIAMLEYGLLEIGWK